MSLVKRPRPLQGPSLPERTFGLPSCKTAQHEAQCAEIAPAAKPLRLLRNTAVNLHPKTENPPKPLNLDHITLNLKHTKPPTPKPYPQTRQYLPFSLPLLSYNPYITPYTHTHAYTYIYICVYPIESNLPCLETQSGACLCPPRSGDSRARRCGLACSLLCQFAGEKLRGFVKNWGLLLGSLLSGLWDLGVCVGVPLARTTL